ncbi:MAG: hypothetical protein WCW17_00900 [Patescibacteria group bacterium]
MKEKGGSGSKKVSALLEKYPGKWSNQLVVFPFMMKIIVEIDNSQVFHDSDYLAAVRQQVEQIVASVPVERRATYSYCLDVLNSPDQVVDIGRAVEYLTIVSVRYILDQISGTDVIGLQAIEGVPKTDGNGRVSIEILLLHNYGPGLDPLLDDCLKLAAEKMRRILRGKPLDMLKILKLKWHNYQLTEEQEEARKGFLGRFTGWLTNVVVLIATKIT